MSYSIVLLLIRVTFTLFTFTKPLCKYLIRKIGLFLFSINCPCGGYWVFKGRLKGNPPDWVYRKFLKKIILIDNIDQPEWKKAIQG